MEWYPEQLPSGTNTSVLLPTPGKRLLTSMPTFPNRALFFMDGRGFAVNGEVVYELFEDVDDDGLPALSALSRGVVATDTRPATICSNGDGGRQLFITSGNNGYIYDLDADTLTYTVADALIGGFLAGYFFKLDASTSTLSWSDLEDGTVWPPLNYAQRTLGADRWTTFAVIHSEVWLLGSQSYEVWGLTGNADLPVAPIPGAFVEYGCAASFSLANIGSSLLWLGANAQGHAVAYRATAGSYQPQEVSNEASEYAWENYDTVADAEAFAYQENGKEWYVLNFPSANTTWVLDSAHPGLWHRRQYWNTSTAQSEVNRARSHALMFGLHVVGDRVTGDLLEQKIGYRFDSGGVAIRRVRRFPHLVNELKAFFNDCYTLNMDVGLGLDQVYSTYSTVLLAMQPDHYYRLGERDGTTATDSAPNGIDLTYSGGYELGVSGLVGDLNTATRFDGLTARVSGAALGVSVSTGWSVAIAIRPRTITATVTDRQLLSDEVFPLGLFYRHTTTGAFVVTLTGGTLVDTTVLTANNNYVAVVTAQRTGPTDTFKFYVNGTLSSTQTLPAVNTFNPSSIGSNLALSRSFQGDIDEVAYWRNRLLTAAEVAAQYAATIAAPTLDPQIMLRYSDDGAKTWSNEDWKSAGAEGEYRTRIEWRKKGRSRDRVIEIAVSDGVPWRLVDFSGDLRPGTGQ